MHLTTGSRVFLSRHPFLIQSRALIRMQSRFIWLQGITISCSLTKNEDESREPYVEYLLQKEIFSNACVNEKNQAESIDRVDRCTLSVSTSLRCINMGLVMQRAWKKCPIISRSSCENLSTILSIRFFSLVNLNNSHETFLVTPRTTLQFHAWLPFRPNLFPFPRQKFLEVSKQVKFNGPPDMGKYSGWRSWDSVMKTCETLAELVSWCTVQTSFLDFPRRFFLIASADQSSYL